MSQGGHSEPLLFLALFYQSAHSCLKVRGGKLECAGGHVELPLVLDLAVHLVNFFGWMSQGGHSEPLSLLALFYQSTPSCLKVMGGWGGLGWVAHVILVSAQGPNPSFFFFFIGLWGLLGHRLGLVFGPGLDRNGPKSHNFSSNLLDET